MSDTPYLDECNVNYRARLAREEAEAARIAALEARCVQLEDNLRIAVKIGLDDQARIAELEAALRNMHAMVHEHVYRSGTPKGFPEGSRTIGPEVLGGINDILKNALGRNDPRLKYFTFPDDSESETPAKQDVVYAQTATYPMPELAVERSCPRGNGTVRECVAAFKCQCEHGTDGTWPPEMTVPQPKRRQKRMQKIVAAFQNYVATYTEWGGL